MKTQLPTGVIWGLCLMLIAVLVYNGTFAQMMGMGGMGRHHRAMMGGLPGQYSGLENPLPVSEAVLQEGGALYQSNCAICHGVGGIGDGPLAPGLNPRPANLVLLARMPMARDDYLFWTISEGGAAFNSAMPAFKTSLDTIDRWKIIHYLRRL